MKIRFHPAHLLPLILLADVAQAQPYRCGQPLPRPAISSAQQQRLDSQLVAALHSYRLQPGPDGLIWVARRYGYLGHYDSAIHWLSLGIQQYPTDARLYRHRGHRYLTTRCYPQAVADLEKAAALVQGLPDETEPDGQPNAAGIPTSTLQQNIYYHLGLAYWLQRQWPQARQAWHRCLDLSTNPDAYVSAANWLHLVLRQLGDEAAACRLLGTISPRAQLLENEVYLRILLLYQQKPATDSLLAQLQQQPADVQGATWLYGLYRYLRWRAEPQAAATVKARLLATGQIASFGYIAAEAEE